MKILFRAVIVLLVAAAGCTTAGERAASATPVPLPTATFPAVPTRTPAAEPPATPTSGPTAEPTSEPAPDTPPACFAAFTPLGFTADGAGLVGKWTADGMTEAALQVLDLDTLAAATFYRYELSTADGPVLSPDAALAAVPRGDFGIDLVRVADGAVLATLSGHTNFVTAIVFSHAGDRIYTGSMDTHVRAWDLSGALLSDFQPDGADGYPSEVTGLGLSPDGALLVTIPLEGRIKLWDAASLSKIGELEGPIFGSYNGSLAVFSPDGAYLAVGLAAGPGAVSLWRLSDQALLWQGGFFTFAFSPDGRMFAHTEPSEAGGERVVLSSIDGQTVMAELPEEFPFAIWRIAFSLDSERLALQFSDVTQVWDLASGEKRIDYRPSCP